MDDETSEGQYVTVERQWLWLYTAVSRVGSTKRVWSCRRKSLNSFNQRVFFILHGPILLITQLLLRQSVIQNDMLYVCFLKTFIDIMLFSLLFYAFTCVVFYSSLFYHV